MRLPWGRWADVSDLFLGDGPALVFGCLSFEQRCCVVPELTSARLKQGGSLFLAEIDDPTDALPDYSAEQTAKREANRRHLKSGTIGWTPIPGVLLAHQDMLLDMFRIIEAAYTGQTVILDMTAFPKRFFCFFLKQLLLSRNVQNVVVAYTQAAGYTYDHLAQDVLPSDALPGYAALSRVGARLVISVGFECLSIRSLILDLHSDINRDLRVLLPFPAPIESVRRQWDTLRQIMQDETANIVSRNVEVVAAWDAEQVFRVLRRWDEGGIGLALAPFGPKPHTLGMALFSIEHQSGMWYTQPKAYNPDYSHGSGDTWLYLTKWKGVKCYERPGD